MLYPPPERERESGDLILASFAYNPGVLELDTILGYYNSMIWELLVGLSSRRRKHRLWSVKSLSDNNKTIRWPRAEDGQYWMWTIWNIEEKQIEKAWCLNTTLNCTGCRRRQKYPFQSWGKLANYVKFECKNRHCQMSSSQFLGQHQASELSEH